MLHQQSFDLESLQVAYNNDVQPAAIVEEVFRRITEANDPGIFIHLRDIESVLAEANLLLNDGIEEKPLWGVPFVIKDNIDADGLPTTAACPDFSYIAEQDAYVVKCLREAGALLIGKTNLDQFATGLVGVRSPYAPPKNALDPQIIPGGSSSGSAVAVARGIVSFSLGTDTAGSGRVPAALNGIVGLKPTLGAISNTGVVPACRTLDTVSIFALTVSDAHAVFNVTASFDPTDAYGRDIPSVSLGNIPPHFKVGVPNSTTREFFGDDIQAASFETSLKELEAIGGEIIELDFTPLYEVAALLYEGAWVAERYSVVEELLKTKPQSLLSVFKEIVSAAENFSSADVFRGFYKLQDLTRNAVTLFENVDFLCVPSIPTFYSVEDLDKDPIGPNSQLGTYTNFVNLLDLCAIAVPVNLRSDGRPGSVTLIARATEDSQIGAIASGLQYRCHAPIGATSWELPKTNVTAAPALEGEFVVAVVGAHMSGLPLNSELTKRGARFLKAGKTSPAYRLYSLPGGPPLRPGLIRDPSGSSIEIELWSMPKSNFGSFMEGIPYPLGIGTLTLENNKQVNGFICESSGIKDAEEVTHFGGWRGYLASLSSTQSQTKELNYEKT